MVNLKVRYEYLDEFKVKLNKLTKKHKPHFQKSWNPFLKVIVNTELFNSVILRKSINIKGTKTEKIDFFKYKDLKVLGHKKNPFRIIYFYIDEQIYFVEIFEKSKQANHSIKLIQKYSKMFG